jgi:hypothetical protein
MEVGPSWNPWAMCHGGVPHLYVRHAGIVGISQNGWLYSGIDAMQMLMQITAMVSFE